MMQECNSKLAVKSVLILWTTCHFVANICVALNVAQHKQTTQSSTYTEGNTKSENAVDGNYEQDMMLTRCSHTAISSNQPHWWAVDLGAIYTISHVVIFGRSDCCSERLSNFNIDVIKPCKNATNWFEGVTILCHHRQEATIYLNATCSNGATGRYVRIQQPKGENGLGLCEVEVHGLFEQDLNSVNLPYTCGFEGHSYDGLEGLIKTVNVNSEIQCTYMCAYVHGCHAADFVRKNNACYLMERKNGSNVVFDPDHNVFLVN
ncbi:unnamed protein product [Mytilus edulis]|uniref:F5/8 type C domain-containing protein n=1 Tax=Mytilus edulis TaxID=6550 RepID=A0A8S3SCX4_MYTED|nr:unnamed protein product [Mytilus edulis]